MLRFFLNSLLFLLVSCTSEHVASRYEHFQSEQDVRIDHHQFDNFLADYVNEKGEVNYAVIQADDALQPYLDRLAKTDPFVLPEKEAIAFWINAYNAYTIKLVIDNYPIGSIKEITPLRIKGLSLSIPKINSPFEYEIADVGGEMYSLDDIEHGILRKEFEEPRIHFALVCASFSCPSLRREAYVGSRLDEQLDDQARKFLHDPQKNQVDNADSRIYLSRIFKWFESDFTRDTGSVQAFVAPYFSGRLQEELLNDAFDVKYLKYNWSLNDVGSFNN